MSRVKPQVDPDIRVVDDRKRGNEVRENDQDGSNGQAPSQGLRLLQHLFRNVDIHVGFLNVVEFFEHVQ